MLVRPRELHGATVSNVVGGGWLVGLVGWCCLIPHTYCPAAIHPLVVVNVLRGRAEACKAGGLCGRDF